MQVTEASSKDAEQSAGRLIVVIKKKTPSMPQCYNKWKEFQRRPGARIEVQGIYSAGPIWVIKTKLQDSTAAVIDIVEDFCNNKLQNQCSVFKSKTALGTMKGGVIKLSYSSLLAIAGMSVERSMSIGIKTQWPDTEGCWSMIRVNRLLVRGRLNVQKLAAMVQVSNEQREGRSQLSSDKHCEANRSARDKSLLMLECNTGASLNPNEVWAKRGRRGQLVGGECSPNNFLGWSVMLIE